MLISVKLLHLLQANTLRNNTSTTVLKVLMQYNTLGWMYSYSTESVLLWVPNLLNLEASKCSHPSSIIYTWSSTTEWSLPCPNRQGVVASGAASARSSSSLSNRSLRLAFPIYSCGREQFLSTVHLHPYSIQSNNHNQLQNLSLPFPKS